MTKPVLSLLCFINRNLRYGNSKSRVIQFLVIRTRTFAKKKIEKSINIINDFGNRQIWLRHAGWMNLSTNDYVDRWLYTGADFEPHIVRLVTCILKKGDCFLDLGANIGYFSLIASRCVGPSGKVYAFEPTPKTIDKLKRNIE